MKDEEKRMKNKGKRMKHECKDGGRMDGRVLVDKQRDGLYNVSKF